MTARIIDLPDCPDDCRCNCPLCVIFGVQCVNERQDLCREGCGEPADDASGRCRFCNGTEAADEIEGMR